MDRATRTIVYGSVVTVILLLFCAGCLIGAREAQPAAPSMAPAAVAVSPRLRPRPRLDVAYASLIEDAAARHDLPPLLVAAITRVESDFDADEISNKGARGLMQVMPETGARFGVPPDLLFDPERNIAAGTAYLSWLLDRYEGDLDLALAGYNAGEGAVDRYRGIPPYPETQRYVRKVRAELAVLEGL